jgi:hypothetical protein
VLALLVQTRLLYCYKSTCFTGTKVRILTQAGDGPHLGCQPCCIPESVNRARELVAWTIAEQDGLINVQVFYYCLFTASLLLKRARELVAWTIAEQDGLINVQVFYHCLFTTTIILLHLYY